MLLTAHRKFSEAFLSPTSKIKLNKNPFFVNIFSGVVVYFESFLVRHFVKQKMDQNMFVI